MKKSRFYLSLLLVPSLVLAGGGGTTCTGGSGGSGTPPVLTLPQAVLGLQAASKGPSTFTMTLSGATGALSDTTTYNAWCTNPNAPVPSSPDAGANQTTKPVTYKVYNSTSFSTFPAESAQDANFGFSSDYPATGFAGSYPLTRAQEWGAVNWVLNNLTVDTDINDVQAVIQTLLHPEAGISSTPYPYLTLFADSYANALALYNLAVANDGFNLGNQNVVAVILDPGPNYQGVIIPVPVPGGGCTAKSGLYLYKAASVTSANAFQAITYGYYVVNTGSTTLTNIVITDDNGTPGYSEDDFTVGTIASLAPGCSQYFFQTVYLPIRLFAQVGNNAIFDTLIPQVPPTTLASGSSIPAGALVLTYLEDDDVFDNTYGTPGTKPTTGASAGWAAVGGHTFSEDFGNYAEFTFYDKSGHLVSDFDADYLSHLGVSSTFPSGYGSAGLHGSMLYGSSSYVQYITSTLADNLNGYSKFYGATTTSPDSDNNWQSTAGYKVQVAQSIFSADKCGAGFGWAVIKKNFVTNSKLGQNLCYTPQTICTKIVSTAWASATVCGCNTTITTSACVSVTLNGCPLPTCGQISQHKCLHKDQCRCTCANCLAGKHNQCTQTKCNDPRCADQGCPKQASPVGTKCNVSGNVYGLCQDGSGPTWGGLDGNGYSYSSICLGNLVNWSGCTFTLPASGSPGCVSGSTVSLPAGNYSTLKCLATGVNGAQYNQTFVVTYTDGSTSTFKQNLSDWCYPSNFSGESVAVAAPYRCTPSGGTQASPNGINVYGYSFPLNSGKTVKCVTLPNNRNVVVSAITCQ